MAQAATLTDTQLRRVLQYVSTRRHALRDRTILQVSFNAGLRAKEIAALLVGDVYGADGAVREHFNLRRAQTKGGHERTVYLNKTLRRALVEYRTQVEHSKPSDALFPTQKQAAFSANTMCQLFLEIYTATGIIGASSHSGRRTFITKLANKGVSVRQLAALAGHANISTTQIYIDVNAEQLANAVELL